MNRVWIISLFPEYFIPLKEHGVAGSALRGERGQKFELNLIQLRDFSKKDYKGVDDGPFGGGVGMIMRADVLKNALIKGVVEKGGYSSTDELHVVTLSPRGKRWNNKKCREFAQSYLSADSNKDLVFICGRYEGIDQRFIDLYVNEEISIGDYVLTGGELATMVILDSSLRFASGVLGNKESAETDSFETGLLEHSLYTRPREFDGVTVPEVYLSGHHANIKKYQMQESVELTKKHRPDLYQRLLQ